MLIIQPDALRRSSEVLRGAADHVVTAEVPAAPAAGASQCATEEGFLALATATEALGSALADLATGLAEHVVDSEAVDHEVERLFDRLMPPGVR